MGVVRGGDCLILALFLVLGAVAAYTLGAIAACTFGIDASCTLGASIGAAEDDGVGAVGEAPRRASAFCCGIDVVCTLGRPSLGAILVVNALLGALVAHVAT